MKTADVNRVNELIDKYGVRFGSDRTKIGAHGAPETLASIRDDMIRLKPQIIEELERRERAVMESAEEEMRKIEAIDGLREIQNAIFELEEWHRKLEESYETEDSPVTDMIRRNRPKHDIPAMKKAHPRAAAYLKAEAFSLSENYAKSRAGRKALGKIIDGDDAEKAIADMEKEWSGYCMERVWD